MGKNDEQEILIEYDDKKSEELRIALFNSLRIPENIFFL